MRIKNRARSFMQIRSSRSRSKRGVSPVIGVILMVAATIVIAGVVMAMLGGFSPTQSLKAVTATAKHINDTAIQITFTGGPDADLVKALNATIDGESVSTTDLGADFINGTVGATAIIDATGGYTIDAGPNNDAVTVTATFKDGSTQVILDVLI